ncbi:hypothetical protein COT75_00685 [Candidatus Beckwithbacteria bacterium CG10_big_fil_rev_8_21_14_0_10_34_10]|uniref:YqaE/Pmp3 family membrane protein n=1 Tax=Candidatus Beckwithbacteria bacterium CG10_big_fil_rev_8_21_14_0_10_34_10 TaxID=1974495 RepID=A0A2H0WCP3_9BACT|nr:MAG: hypothetical protein COT75_00685 [Candidatus Beckwithbacteria bacterium CG10_big_fil_rev_8_21_14_0_10_34_10]
MSKEQYVCRNCGYIGVPKKVTPGSIIIELGLWIIMILPGVIYSIWRSANKKTVCKQCKSEDIIPINTPKGQELLKLQTKKK